MCFYSNQHPLSTKHPFISFYSKYHPFILVCLLNMNSPVFPSLDDIYCTYSQSFFLFTWQLLSVYVNYVATSFSGFLPSF